ncbi:SDR family NAD(P)-dependent oxidoreductase [Aestuariibacter salexigens]|uniref:SDR family NAD(P)-dependent oxidoreductase n=1 Tax=Aestuariibacter salexigens TaxID=226010 RepID=UPI0004134E79|nr:SDR family oxidoreductase [Aestuariibacter salexigens]
MKKLKTALITGASEGIGRCLAYEFARHGHDLVLVARNEERLLELAAELSAAFSVKVHCEAVDLIPVGAPTALFNDLEKQGINVDILINNAGMMQVEKFAESDPVKLNNLMQLNIQSLVNMTQMFIAPMLARGKGKIVNIASIAGFMPTPGFTVYGATKAFVLSFSEGISQELSGTGVTVTCVCPGVTKTAMMNEAGGLEKLIPGVFKASPESLAKQAYNACANNDVVFVDKLANKVLVQWATHYPRWLVRKVNGFVQQLK